MKNNYRFLLLITLIIPFCGLALQSDPLMKRISTHRTDTRIRLFITYLDSIQLQEKTSRNLEPLFVGLKKLDDQRLNRYIEYNRRMVSLSSKTFPNKIKIMEYMFANYQDSDDILFEGICLQQMAQLQFDSKKYDIALRNAIKANEIFKEVGYGNIPEIGKYLHGFALIHYFFKDYNKVLDLMKTSYLYPTFSSNMDIQRDNNIAQSYLGLNNKDQAMRYLRKALSKAKKYKNHSWIGLLMGNIGDLYSVGGNHAAAFEYYERGINYIDKQKAFGSYRIFLLKLARGYIQLGHIPEAKYNMEVFLRTRKNNENFFGFNQQDENTKLLYYEVCKLFYAKTKDYRRAYQYADSLHVFSKHMDHIYDKLQIDLSHHRLNTEKYIMELDVKEKEKQLIVYRYVLALILVIIISGGMIYFIKKKKDRQKKLFLKQAEVMKEKQDKLKGEVHSLKDHIKSHLRNITENNVLLEQYKDDLEHLKMNRGGRISSKNRIHSTEININQLKILTKEQWENFLTDFKDVNKRFYNEITRSFPELTSSEQRLLFLLKLGVPLKELPSVIGTSDGNIRVLIHRIRTKIKDKDGSKSVEKILPIIKNS